MKMPENIVSYTSEELAAMEARGESRTDWQRVKAMTDADIDAAIASDPDAEEITEEDWQHVTMTIPVQLDAEMMTWLKSQGEDYQVHIQRLVREEMQQKRGSHEA
jgi:uncharacterized protein (DUF4415 family)